ncbi:MAG TPA: leucyl aminopeptidase family protein [Nocardioidaceae bacterium]|nr:leucyl aminopeptidase family protein [Nocardioidaceae bacterium]
MPAPRVTESLAPADGPSLVASAEPLARVSASTLAVGYTRESGAYVIDTPSLQALDEVDVDAFALLRRADASGRGGDVIRHEVVVASGSRGSRFESIVLVGLGKETGIDFRRAGAAVSRAARSGATVATAIGARADDDQLAAFGEGVVLGGFRFSRKSERSKRKPATITLAGVASRRSPIVTAAVERAHASWRSRSYALTPSNEKGPARLEQWAREAADGGGLDIDVWDEHRLEHDGFGGILAVGHGSAYPSRFIRLDYAPSPRARGLDTIVLVGKGVTFDSGGISIKPSAAMQSMKRDMTGAAVVIATMGALRSLGVRARVVGLIPSAENAFGAASMRPGDVVAHYGGRTSEVQNTDAEGRLLLADGMAYAAEQIEPDVMIDVATLTGAVKVTLGTTVGGLFSNDDVLASALVEAGERSGEPLWRLPLTTDYEELIASDVADANNASGTPGAVTAALFLQHFVGDARWAHLDIASVGDSEKDAFEYTKGATGFGARLLLRWLTATYA